LMGERESMGGAAAFLSDPRRCWMLDPGRERNSIDGRVNP
jgi:hypothetical protein